MYKEALSETTGVLVITNILAMKIPPIILIGIAATVSFKANVKGNKQNHPILTLSF